MRWIDRQRQRKVQSALGGLSELIVFFVVLMIAIGLWMMSVKP